MFSIRRCHVFATTMLTLCNGFHITPSLMKSKGRHQLTAEHDHHVYTYCRQIGLSSSITDWVVENLESDESKITWSSSTMAGENDTLPMHGLCIGNLRIMAAGNCDDSNVIFDDDDQSFHPILLLVGRNGWGTGVHPTTRLCLEFLSSTITGQEIVLDYGCGSGILSIAALRLGAMKCIGVDVEAEALVTAERNIQLNGYGENFFEPLHTREVLPFDIYPGGIDVCMANILIGQLVRPSMVAVLATNVKPGGIICFSGIRTHEVDSLKTAYEEYVEEWLDDQYATLSASDCEGSIDSYGYDCGKWCRLVARTKSGTSKYDILAMSELAVS